MYADQMVSGRKLSVKDRLQGDLVSGSGSGRQMAGVKRQRTEDTKWKHDLYTDTDGPQSSRPRLGSRDLRLKLQRKEPELAQGGGRNPGGIRDLREKLSGAMNQPPGNASRLTKVAVTVRPVTKTPKKSVPSAEENLLETKKATGSAPAPASALSKKKSQQAEESIDQFLQSLGLDKYLITFQAEEVDMAALVHMTDEDLRAVGIPMGPRKKIRLALDSRS